MIKTLEKAGRTEDDAIQAALKELGMDRDDVSVEILERAKSGFFGIGASPAVVRVTYECPDEPVKESTPVPMAEAKPTEKPSPVKSAVPAQKTAADVKETKAPSREKKSETAKTKASEAVLSTAAPAGEEPQYKEIRDFLTGLFEHMGIEADLSFSTRENGGIDVNLSGNGMGAIIGRRGETLDAIQHLTNYVVNHGNEKRRHINIDAEAYRSKREESLSHLAEKMAEKALKYKRNMALEPMNSYERHVIHTALQDYKGVTTASTGEEPNRRVVVMYVKPEGEEAVAASSSRPKVREWA